MSAITNDGIRQYLVNHLKDSSAKGISNIYIIFSQDTERVIQGNTTSRENFSSICNAINNDGTVQAKFAKKLRGSDPAVANLLNYAISSEFGITGDAEVNINGLSYTISSEFSLENLWNGLYANIDLSSKASTVYNVVTVVANLKTTTGTSASADFVTTFKYDPSGTDSFGDDTIMLMQFKPSNKTITAETQEFPVLMLF